MSTNKKGPGRVGLSGNVRHYTAPGVFYVAPNPPGSKVARKALKHSGRKWKGEVYHTGDLPTLYAARQQRHRKGRS